VVRIEEVAGVLKRVRSYRENLNAALLELLVPVPQLREMPAAERSHEAAQKHQHDRLPAQFRSRYFAAVDGGQCEVGCFGADRDGFRVNGHGDWVLGEASGTVKP